jgi:hypothetical protein
MPPPIDENAILRHLGGKGNGIKPYPNYEGVISMNNNLTGLHAGSVSIVKKCGMAEI